jgi:uncharacterized protein YrrD
MNDQARSPRRVLSASTVNGTSVRSPDGEDLGKIEELMFDRDTGRMAYAVLSFGGFLGMGDKLFAIPWQALSLDPDREEAVLPVDKTVLENAPGFDKDHWPDFADPTWSGQIHEHYGTEPYWTQ